MFAPRHITRCVRHCQNWMKLRSLEARWVDVVLFLLLGGGQGKAAPRG